MLDLNLIGHASAGIYPLRVVYLSYHLPRAKVWVLQDVCGRESRATQNSDLVHRLHHLALRAAGGPFRDHGLDLFCMLPSRLARRVALVAYSLGAAHNHQQAAPHLAPYVDTTT